VGMAGELVHHPGVVCDVSAARVQGKQAPPGLIY
jgi:hypothetical protein